MKKIIIIGAGASGLLAAIYAKNKENEVIVLEKNSFAMKKLLITGSGRCNYFNENFFIEKYNESSDILKKIISYKEEYLNFFESIGIEPNVIDGYYYPYSNSAVSVQNALLIEANNKGIKFLYDYEVIDILKKDDKYLINEELLADKLIISTGSKCYPKTGSSGEMYEILSNLNIKINPINPALVKLKTNNKIASVWPTLRVKANLSLSINNEIVKTNYGELQLIESGISGICTFNISSLAIKKLREFNNVSVYINFLPFKKNYGEFIEKRVKNMPTRNIVELFEGIVNYKLLITLFEHYKLDIKKSYEELSEKNQEKLIGVLTNLKIEINDCGDYSAAQVCSGGVSLEEINLNMEFNKHHNLFATGEIIDVDGECGGYNLAFAFISGIIAGKKAGNND